MAVAVLGLAACEPAVPDSGAGVGFGDYAAYEAARLERERQLTGRSSVDTVVTGAPATVAASSAGSGAIGADELAAAGIGTAGGAAPTQAPAATARADQTALALNPSGREVRVDASPSNARISDEQNFDAVTGRETIASDAARRQQQAAQYQVIQPTAVPERTASGPNIVAYALQTTNAPGQPVIDRGFVINAAARYERGCSAYASADIAQQDFLARGGPAADPLVLDPDGDGFACGWDPRPFRAAVGR